MARTPHSSSGDLLRIPVVAAVVGTLVGLLLHVTGVGRPVLWGILAAALSTLLVGPVSGRRPARSNSSG